MRSVGRPPPRSDLSDTAHASHRGGRDRGPGFRLRVLAIAQRDVEMSIAGGRVAITGWSIVPRAVRLGL